MHTIIFYYSTAVDMFLSIATRRGVQWSVEKIKFHSVPSMFPRWSHDIFTPRRAAPTPPRSHAAQRGNISRVSRRGAIAPRRLAI